MNTPNKLTLLRVILVPVYAIIMTLSYSKEIITRGDLLILVTEYNSLLYVAGIIFIVASLTDLLDGKIARKYDMVTDFGKFADPVADKLLVLTAVIYLTDAGRVTAWSLLIIVAREIIVAGVRNMAVLKNRVIAADIYGKLKTLVQLIAISCMHFEMIIPFMVIPDTILYYIGIVLTILSGINYTYKNFDVFKEVK